MIYVGTGVTKNYLDKALPYLLSLQENVKDSARYCVHRFCITVGFRVPESYRKMLPGINFHYLAPYLVENMNDNFCVQQGAFLKADGFDSEHISNDDVIIFTDSDISVQREFSDSELELINSLSDGDVAVNHNAHRYDSLLNEAMRLQPTVDISIINGIAKFFSRKNLLTSKCYNTGCVMAKASTWSDILYGYNEMFPTFNKYFQHYAKQQWVLSLEFESFNVIDLPMTTHSHGKYGVSPEISFKNSEAYRDNNKIMFAHALCEPFKKICLVLKGTGGCAYYRGTQWVEMLKAKYFDKVQYSVCTGAVDDNILESADIIFLHNAVSSEVFFKVMAQKKKGKLVIYDVDDDYFNIDDENAGGQGFKTPEVESTCISFLRNADIITVSTEYLREYYIDFLTSIETTREELEKKVVVMQNNVDFKVWDEIKNRTTDKYVTIGWQGGSSHTKDMRPFVRMMERYLKSHPKVHFAMVGEMFMKMFTDKSILPQLELIGWHSDSKHYGDNISNFDIGVAPLADLKFNNSKSNLKWLEYSALGIPSIVSESVPYSTVDDEETGYVISGKWDGKTDEMPADVEKKWVKALDKLVNDKQLRYNIGESARKHVKKHYNAYEYVDKWAKLLGIKED